MHLRPQLAVLAQRNSRQNVAHSRKIHSLHTGTILLRPRECKPLKYSWDKEASPSNLTWLSIIKLNWTTEGGSDSATSQAQKNRLGTLLQCWEQLPFLTCLDPGSHSLCCLFFIQWTSHDSNPICLLTMPLLVPCLYYWPGKASLYG